MGKTTVAREDTSSATPIIKTTITEEVAIAEAEAEEVETMETETSLRELTVRMVNHRFYPLLIFLFSTPRILRNLRQLMREKISLVI